MRQPRIRADGNRICERRWDRRREALQRRDQGVRCRSL